MPMAPVPWRKTLRAENKGIRKHHYSRKVETPERVPGSTWIRRHRWQIPS